MSAVGDSAAASDSLVVQLTSLPSLVAQPVECCSDAPFSCPDSLAASSAARDCLLPVPPQRGTSRLVRRANVRGCAGHTHEGPSLGLHASDLRRHAALQSQGRPPLPPSSADPAKLSGWAVGRVPAATCWLGGRTRQRADSCPEAADVLRQVGNLRDVGLSLRGQARAWDQHWLDVSQLQRREGLQNDDRAAVCSSSPTPQSSGALSPANVFTSTLPNGTVRGGSTVPEEAGLDNCKAGQFHKRIESRLEFYRAALSTGADDSWSSFAAHCRGTQRHRARRGAAQGDVDYVARNRETLGQAAREPAGDHRLRVQQRGRECALRRFAVSSQAMSRKTGCADVAATLGIVFPDLAPDRAIRATKWGHVLAVMAPTIHLLQHVRRGREADAVALHATGGRLTVRAAVVSIQHWFRACHFRSLLAWRRKHKAAIQKIFHTCIRPAAARARQRARQRSLSVVLHFLRALHRQSSIHQAMRNYRLRVRRCQRFMRMWLLYYQSRVHLWDIQLRAVEDWLHEESERRAREARRESRRRTLRGRPSAGRASHIRAGLTPPPPPEVALRLAGPNAFLPPGWRSSGKRKKRRSSLKRRRRDSSSSGDEGVPVRVYVDEVRRRRVLMQEFRRARATFWEQRQDWLQRQYQWQYQQEAAAKHQAMLVSSGVAGELAEGVAAQQVAEYGPPPKAPWFPLLLPLHTVLRIAESMRAEEQAERAKRAAERLGENYGSRPPSRMLDRMLDWHWPVTAAVCCLAGAVLYRHLRPQREHRGRERVLVWKEVEPPRPHQELWEITLPAIPPPARAVPARPLSPCAPPSACPAEYARRRGSEARRIADEAVSIVMSTVPDEVTDPYHRQALAEHRARIRRPPKLPNRSPPPRRRVVCGNKSAEHYAQEGDESP
eukprot:TRINITY_DN21172_c0_g1_i1.p1 TRINITY_DN21172_c0_g1~~TRINITY_DN21172_c0_g1_i1.p1  ORF type:complete len:893 (+),score=227.89 TRINITY_DN21172_c0_g1_i1:65-2743(+)